MNVRILSQERSEIPTRRARDRAARVVWWYGCGIATVSRESPDPGGNGPGSTTSLHRCAHPRRRGLDRQHSEASSAHGLLGLDPQKHRTLSSSSYTIIALEI